MALATTCPRCKTSFRVVPDQLKLRRGFVRCGRCHNVFAGVDHLRYVDDARLRARQVLAASGKQGTASAGQTAASAETELHTQIAAGPEPDDFVIEDGSSTEADADARLTHDAAADAETPDDAPLDAGAPGDTRVVDFAAEGEAELAPPAEGDDIEQAAAGTPNSDTNAHFPSDGDDVEWVVAGTPAFDALHDEPPADDEPAKQTARHADASAETPADTPPAADRDETSAYVERLAAVARDDDNDESAIDYFSTRRSRGFADRRGLAAGFIALALAIVLATQWVVAQRSTIAARVPAVAPLLAAALAPFGLRIEAPSELDALTIESFELQASASLDVLEMRALLRNRADHPVRWPSMQLTLTDPASRVLVSRSLHPDDYLPEADDERPKGVPARSEWPLRLALETRNLQPAGYDYRVRLFYP